MRWRVTRNVTKKHKWFAWFPIYVSGGFVWLETVERRKVFLGAPVDAMGYGTDDGWTWEYTLSH